MALAFTGRLVFVATGQLVEVDRADLVAGYVSQTSLKVTERGEAVLRGVLFIDEVFALVVGRGEDDLASTLSTCW